jgi:HK97 family phage major capsid protein
MITTLDGLRKDAEARKLEAERKLSDSKAASKRISDAANARGSAMTADEAADFQRANLDGREARDALGRIDGELATITSVETEEAANDAAAAIRRPTNAPRLGDSRTVNAGNDASALYGAGNDGKRWTRDDGRPAAVESGQRFSDHEIAKEYAARDSGREAAIIGTHGNLGTMLRSMTTSTGSAIVPSQWSGSIIDRARNYAAVLQAGATLVPMDRKILQVGRLTVDPVASFRTEGSTITASDPTLDNVTLTSKSLNCLVVGSLEWFQDSSPNADELVTNAIAKAMAVQLDLVALYGGVTTGAEQTASPGNNLLPVGGLPNPPNPSGVLAGLIANASSSVLGSATNGTVQTAASFYGEVLDTLYTVRDFNENPTALIWPSHLARIYAKAADSTNQPMRQPPDVEQITKCVSNQIPSGFTQGTGTLMSDLFVGDFSQLLVGMRMDLSVKMLSERYAELGQLALLATMRCDVQLARPRAFAVYRYLKGV